MPPTGASKETPLNACTTHDWTQIDESTWAEPGKTIYACTQCPETVAACHTCHKPCDTANAACTKCVQKSHQTLEDITLALSHPMAPLLPLRAIRYDHSGRSSTDSMPFGIGNELDDPEVIRAEMTRLNKTALEVTRDTTTLMDALDGWAAAWANDVNEQHGETVATLKRLTTWAINNPHKSGWHDYIQEAKTVRHRLYTIVGLNPEKETIPCPYCGSTLIRRWTHDGLAQDFRCTQRDTNGNHVHCERKTYKDEADLFWVASTAIRDAPEINPNIHVTRDDIHRIYPRIKPTTLREWRHRGELKPTGKLWQGKPMYHLAQVDTLYNRAYGQGNDVVP